MYVHIMRCVKFDKQISTAASSQPFQLQQSINLSSRADLAPSGTTTALPKTLASSIPATVCQVTSTLKEKLSSPVLAVQTTLNNVQAVTKGQSTISQDTLVIQSEMTTKTAPRGETKAGGGRHPNPPPIGSNKKLKHACPFDGCQWRFATPYKLRRHIKSHTKETPYLCKECGRGFSVRYNLLMHIQTIHGQAQRYKCTVKGCKEAFHSQSRLNGHLRKVHKKDIKCTEKLTPRCDSRGNSTSSMDSVGDEEVPRTVRQPRKKYECDECGKVFNSQTKLSSHSRSHNNKETVSNFSTEDCCESIDNKDRLSKHLENHKNGRQFTCPHENCNRVFLHRSHLKNHLKIHTKDHQFVCLVIDCNAKFNSEHEYNHHLGSHINYSHKCPFPDCELSFMSEKRLSFHLQAVHGHSHNDGAQISFLEGIQPHLGVNHQSSYLLPCSSVYTPFTSHHDQPIKTEPGSYADAEFIKEIIPDRSQKNFETIFSQFKDWSGEKIDQFLHSAVDLSEIETQLCSSGYESDSGYSTYDVSPLATHPPVALSHPIECLPHPYILPQPTHGPMFNSTCAYSPTGGVFQDPIHSTTSSPCSIDGSFFSHPADLEALAGTANQTQQYLMGDVNSQGIQLYHQPQIFVGGAYIMEDQGSYLNSRIPDILVQNSDQMERRGNSFVSCRRNSDSQVTLGENSNNALRGQLPTRSLPNMGELSHLMKTEDQFHKCSVLSHVTSSTGNVKTEIDQRQSCNAQRNTRATQMKATKKKTNPKPPNQRRTNQWPRSMSKANMMAFRQHILSRLKKGQENSTDSFAVKQEATSPKAMSEHEFTSSTSENEGFEIEVKVQRNHSSDNRSQSEPMDSSNSPTLAPMLHQSHSEGNVNNKTPLHCNTDTSHLTELFSDDIFNTLSFNPDSLLSHAEEEQMLQTLGFSENDDEIASLLGVSSNSLVPAGPNAGQVMDLDCIQELLDSDQNSSPSLPSLTDPSLDSSLFDSNTNSSHGCGSPSSVTMATNSQPITFYPPTTSSQYNISPIDSMVRMNENQFQVQSDLFGDKLIIQNI